MQDSRPTSVTDVPRPRRNRRARVRYNAALKVVRRVHLYAGLFMTPWVLLYGITGFLFNHPEAFPDRDVHIAHRADLSGTALAGFPTAPDLAEQIVKALNEQAGSPPCRLVDRAHATYSRTLFVTATGSGREHNVRIDPDSGDVFVRSTTEDLTPTTGSINTTLALADSPRERLSTGVPAVLAKFGLRSSTTSLKNPPDLVCTIERAGQRWRLAYNLQSGATTTRPLPGATNDLSTRRFLTGLHLAFTYPSRFDVRWLWALIVDAMFLSMVFWSGSGVLMWWQLKKLRWSGAVTLLASIAVAVAVALGMHEVVSLR